MLGLALAIWGAASQIDFCFDARGCEDESIDGGAAFALFVGFFALAAAPLVAAWRSGWPRWFGAGVLAAAAFMVTLVIGAGFFGLLVDDILPGLVLALGVEASIAIRPPLRSARAVRVVVVGVLLALAAGFAAGNQDLGIVVLAIVTLPAIGVADTIALRSERRDPVVRPAP